MKATLIEPLLPRFLPNLVPALYPLPEYLAEGKLADAYTDMKETLQVPWMCVVTMAYAHYPTFFRELWDGLRPIVQSASFINHCRELRAWVEDAVMQMQPTALPFALNKLGYAPRELE